MVRKNLSMVRGDTMQFDMKLEHVEATVVSVDFTCKVKGTDTTPVFHKELGDGITLVDDTIYRVRVAPEDTASADAGKYVYDLQLGLGSDIYTIMLGELTLIQDVTDNA